MRIIVSGISYQHSNQHPLFVDLSFSVGSQEKVTIVGNNGVGKSTLLRLMSGQLFPLSGDINCGSMPYYVPQHTGQLDKTVAEVLGVNDKLNALRSIMQGSIAQTDYDLLNDDWEIESRCEAAFAYWRLPEIGRAHV